MRYEAYDLWYTVYGKRLETVKENRAVAKKSARRSSVVSQFSEL
jgi:hypothetical protein